MSGGLGKITIDGVPLSPSIPYDYTRLFDMMNPGQEMVISEVEPDFAGKLQRSKNARGKFESRNATLVFTKE